MSRSWKSNPAKSVMFVVSYDDARTAYLWVDNHAQGSDDRVVSAIARAQQEQGMLPEGAITNIRRVRERLRGRTRPYRRRPVERSRSPSCHCKTSQCP